MDYNDQLKKMSDEEAREYIIMLSEGYLKRKRENRLFEESSEIPKIIINTYYYFVKKPLFKNIIDNFKATYFKLAEEENFKKRYLYNENKLEEVHSLPEEKGLRLVYDYVQKKDLQDISIYTLSDIHEILYSQTPYPEFGGKYRTEERYLPGTGMDLTSPDLIVHEMNLLRDEMDELVKEGIMLGDNQEKNNIIDYINKCLALKCKIIKIHPFGDGNGRSVRAFINLLFRLANIPPVYIENRERKKYAEAMNSAILDGDFSKLNTFYYYKICDSIISLDILVEKKEMEYKDASAAIKFREKNK